MKKYIIDESLIVFLDRNEDSLVSRLSSFLEDGKKTKTSKKYEFFMPFNSKIRLGGGFRFWLNFIKTKNLRIGRTDILPIKEQARERYIISKKYVKKYLKLLPLTKWYYRTLITNLFIDVNDQKSKDLISTGNGKMKPHEVISLEICEIALLSHINKYPIVSFNDDFKYFRRIRTVRNFRANIIPAEEILQDYYKN